VMMRMKRPPSFNIHTLALSTLPVSCRPGFSLSRPLIAVMSPCVRYLSVKFLRK
jgi:hypothetical protein